MPPPDPEARTAILQLELAKRATSSRVLNQSWLTSFARDELEGYTGAEVVSIVQAAAEQARDSKATEIGCQHLVSARHRVPPSTLEAYYKQMNSSGADISDDQTPLAAFPKAISASASSLDSLSSGLTPPAGGRTPSVQLYIAISAVIVAVMAILMAAFIAMQKM